MYTTTAAAILAVAALASAQNLALLATLPSCAQKPVEGALGSTGCGLTDVVCICKSAPFIKQLQSEIASVCSPADQQASLAFAEKFCGGAGVSLNIPTPSAPASSAPPASSAAPASSSPAVSSAPVVAPVSQVTDGQVQAATSKAATQITDGQVQVPTGGAAPPKNVTAPTTASPVPFTGAASQNGIFGCAFVLVAGLVAAMAL